MSFWELIFVLLIFVPLVMLWIFALTDLARRVDISGLAKALWAIAIVFFPLIGMVVYFIVRPADAEMAKGPAVRMEETKAEDNMDLDKLEQLDKLGKLKAAGTISEDEFNRLKTQLLG